ncbi:hypothetical protein MATL_G00229110 [Megalops atlanticus]|uniref:Solute carrier family 39 member 1 n=1 Tax=Megalops atlanticus TaxID=7932 RepID=A0A9D3PDF0_MEGAT|nr:hypothetical protein MATL_G00229110 [Megalops atlanticus]
MALGDAASSGELLGLEPSMDASPGSMSALAVKLVSLAVLLCATLLCGFAPLCTGVPGRCNANPAARCEAQSLVSCFAGGVFLATCLLDLVPDYLKGINEAFDSVGITLKFPLPEFIMAMGFFLVLVMEQIVLAYKDKSGGFTDERRALLVEPGSHSHEKDKGGRSHLRSPIGQPGGESGSGGGGGSDVEGVHFHVDFNSHSAIRSFILVFSLSLHSVFEGLAVGLQRDGQRVLEVCTALLLHKSVIAFSLSLKLRQARLRRGAVAGCLLLFSLMSPLGVGVGVALTEAPATPRHRLSCSALEGLATGTFLYITFMEILPHELGSPQSRIPRLVLLLTGFAAVTGFLFIKL